AGSAMESGGSARRRELRPEAAGRRPRPGSSCLLSSSVQLTPAYSSIIPLGQVKPGAATTDDMDGRYGWRHVMFGVLVLARLAASKSAPLEGNYGSAHL